MTKQVLKLNIVEIGVSSRGRWRDIILASLLPFQIKVDRDRDQAKGQQAESAGENDDRRFVDRTLTFSNIERIVFEIGGIHGEMCF